jgi:hypothetical protein
LIDGSALLAGAKHMSLLVSKLKAFAAAEGCSAWQEDN